jgi:hypothetical protein
MKGGGHPQPLRLGAKAARNCGALLTNQPNLTRHQPTSQPTSPPAHQPTSHAPPLAHPGHACGRGTLQPAGRTHGHSHGQRSNPLPVLTPGLSREPPACVTREPRRAPQPSGPTAAPGADSDTSTAAFWAAHSQTAAFWAAQILPAYHRSPLGCPTTTASEAWTEGKPLTRDEPAVFQY